MRADPRTAFGVALALVLSAGPAAHAQGVTGHAQLQFQTLDQIRMRSDGSTRRDRVERWLQVLELQHFATPRSDLRVMSSFRITDLAYRGLPDQSRQPQGSVQVTHPWASVFAAYRPTTVTGGLGPNGASDSPDSSRGLTITTRAQETVLTGQIAPPAWPRLDLAWTRRHRDGDVLTREETGTSRSARLGWTNDFLNLYGGWGDQQAVRAGFDAGTTQRTANAGGSLHLAPSRVTNVDLAYDLNDSRAGDPRRSLGSSRGHTASMSANWRPGALVNGSGTWLWRRSESRGPQPVETEDHEGSVQFVLDPRGPSRFLAASGARTVRTPLGRRLATSVSGVASMDGRVRQGWTGVATVTHVTNWAPGLRAWSVEAIRAGSQMTLLRGLECSGDAQVSTSDDTTLRDVNTTTEANARVRMTPWKAFTLGWNGRLSRAGAGVLQGGASAARTTGFDARWRPFANLELSGTHATTVARGGLFLRTRSASGRWQPHPNLQCVADWSRNSDVRAITGISAVSGREVWSVRMLTLLTRKLQLEAAAGVADRGSPRENRQGTLTLTWAFGR